MNQMIIFLGQFTLSLILYAVLSKFFVCPFIKKMSNENALSLLILPHAFRHLGILAIVPSVVAPELTKTSYAANLALGDLIVMPLAVLSIWAWQSNWKSSKIIVWVFSIIASIDLLSAILNSLFIKVSNYSLTAFGVVLTFIVPMLVVSQVLIFKNLHSGKCVFTKQT